MIGRYLCLKNQGEYRLFKQSLIICHQGSATNEQKSGTLDGWFLELSTRCLDSKILSVLDLSTRGLDSKIVVAVFTVTIIGVIMVVVVLVPEVVW